MSSVEVTAPGMALCLASTIISLSDGIILCSD